MQVRGFIAAAIVAIALSATGCTGEPPAPTPTPLFATEADAFAAAEETYRAYVDALNNVDLSDPATFEPVFALTTREQNSNDRRDLVQYHADGYVVSGESHITLLEPETASNGFATVSIAVCVDVSQVTLRTADGTSLTEPDRPEVQSMSVDLVPSDATAHGLRIATIRGRSGDPDCT